MELSEARKEQIFGAKKELEKAAGLLGEILSGDSSQANAARELGLRPDELNHMIATDFAPFLRRIRALDEKEVYSLIHEQQTPEERLLKDILGIDSDRAVVFVDYDDGQALLKAAKEKLRPRDYSVLQMRYGLDGARRMTLDSIGKKIGVNRERARQIQVNSLRKLRNHHVLCQVLPWYRKYAETEEAYRALLEKDADYEKAYEKAAEKYQDLVQKKAITGLLLEAVEEAAPTIQRFLGTPLSALEDFREGQAQSWLPALAADGCVTVGDLQELGERRLIRIACNQKLYLSDLYAACDKLCIHLYAKKEERPDVYINDIDMSSRLYNILARAGIKTLQEAARMTDKELMSMRNMGIRSFRELMWFFEKYGIENIAE